MRKLFIAVVFLISIASLNAQNSFLSPYNFSDSITLKCSTYDAATYLSYIGEYQKALESMNKFNPSEFETTKQDSIYFNKFKPIPAIDFIVNKAKTEQIIIVNEAHHQPYHRAFTIELLKGLYKQGYRYLGAETISAWDTLLNERKYPTRNSGIYTQEPVYGNLIRTALEIGFEIFPYEITVFITDSTAEIRREIEQAKNIKKILDKDPKAKILIHCGYDHLIETEVMGWEKAMAGRLLEYTSINPFTINQVKLTEQSSIKFENPYFKMVDLNYYALFIDSNGALFNGPADNKQYDARVYHPRTKWVDGRPNWMFENNRKAIFINEKISTEYPCLVFAYISSEWTKEKGNYNNLIPYDVIEIKNKNELKALSLKSENYDILIKDQKGHDQFLKLTVE